MGLKVVHYLNQFFGGIGAEDKAHVGPVAMHFLPDVVARAVSEIFAVTGFRNYRSDGVIDFPALQRAAD